MFLLLFLHGCSFILNQSRERGTFNYDCSLIVKYEEHSLYGDCYVYQNKEGFYIDMFTFGSLVFRLQEKDKKLNVFMQGHEYNYSLEDKIFSISYKKFKDILLSFLEQKEVPNELNQDFEVSTFTQDDGRKLVFRDLKKENYIEFVVKK